jgi:hypothetical protein
MATIPDIQTADEMLDLIATVPASVAREAEATWRKRVGPVNQPRC